MICTPLAEIRIPRAELAGAPHLQQYLGAWAITEDAARLLTGRVRDLDLAAHLRSTPQATAPPAAGDEPRSNGYKLSADGVAIIEINGVLTKYSSSLAEGTAYLDLRHAVRNAARAPAVKSILLLIDSPGGGVMGLDDAARDIAAAGQQKPTAAYIEDLGASAAYYLASQTQRISANPAGLVGSIGTYAVVYDASKMAEQIGLRVHVLKSGTFKGAGEPGTVVTDEQLAEFQRIVDQYGAMFRAAVAAGRKLSAERVAALADGRMHLAADAVALGLVDRVESFDDVLRHLAGPSPAGGLVAVTTTQKGITIMPEKATEPRSDEATKSPPMAATPPVATAPAAPAPPPASVLELTQKFPQAADGFIVRCAKAQLSLAQAEALYDPDRDSRQAATASTPPAAPAEPKVPRSGTAGVGSRNLDPEYASARAVQDERERHPFALAAAELARRENIPLAEARSRVAAEDPDQYDAYREQYRTREPKPLRKAG